jgi:hypothetical protein
MADYQYGGSEEENAEIRNLETELVRVPYALTNVHLVY